MCLASNLCKSGVGLLGLLRRVVDGEYVLLPLSLTNGNIMLALDVFTGNMIVGVIAGAAISALIPPHPKP